MAFLGSSSMKSVCAVLLVICVLSLPKQAQAGRLNASNSHKEGKFLSLFNRVQFKNEECQGSDENEDNKGICMSENECEDAGGDSIGNCAAGFGTCCMVIHDRCGGTITHNNTYIRNPEYPSASNKAQVCTWTIKRKNENICFARLDFLRLEVENFDTTGANPRMDCINDQLNFEQGSGFFITTICGNNNGLHMYLDAGAEERNLPMRMIMTTTGTGTDRYYNIRVAQIPCGEPYTPWQGCRMYFTESGGSVKSYNFDGRYHLNFQSYTICVRRNEHMCRIMWRAADEEKSFKLTNVAINMLARNGEFDCRNDYVISHWGAGGYIYGACRTNRRTANADADDFQPSEFSSRFCGSGLNCYAETTSQRGQLIQQMSPFEFSLNTNARETAMEAENWGFSLDFTQLPC